MENRVQSEPQAQDRKQVRLTFDLPTNFLTRLKGVSSFQSGGRSRVQTSKQAALYFDSRRQVLANHGLSLRVQKTGRRYLQHLEAGVGRLGAAAIRQEWTNPLPTEEPVLAAINNQTLRETLRPSASDRLEPVFRTEVERKTRRLALDSGSSVFMDIDNGAIVTDTGREPIRELTLSMDSGPDHGIFDLALEIHAKVPLRLSIESRAHRGLALVLGLAPESHRADKFSLRREATVEDALTDTVQHCLDHMLENEACVLESEDPEGVHQMRVAMRRLRSALRIFRTVLPAEQYLQLNGELKYLADQMAALRDWDVFLEEIVGPAAAQLPEEPAFKLVRNLVVTQREHCRHAARNAIRSKRYTTFLLHASAWLAKQSWRDQPVSESSARLFGPVTDFADIKLEKANRRVVKAGRRFKYLTIPDRHQMRIDVKKLRYATDFFSSIYGRKAVGSFAESLADLQDSLGYLNDIAVAEELVGRISESCESDEVAQCRYAGGIVIGWHSHALAASEPALRRNVKAFVASKPFWSK